MLFIGIIMSTNRYGRQYILTIVASVNMFYFLYLSTVCIGTPILWILAIIKKFPVPLDGYRPTSDLPCISKKSPLIWCTGCFLARRWPHQQRSEKCDENYSKFTGSPRDNIRVGRPNSLHCISCGKSPKYGYEQLFQF